MFDISLTGPTVKNARVSEIENNVPLNAGQMLKQKLQIKNCNPREICRDVVGRQFLKRKRTLGKFTIKRMKYCF